MKTVHYEVEIRDVFGDYSQYDSHYVRKYRIAKSALNTEDAIANKEGVRGTRVVKVTREPLSRQRIKKGDY